MTNTKGSSPVSGPQVPPPCLTPRPAGALLPFPSRNKQPAVPTAAARATKRAPGASPGEDRRAGGAARAGLRSWRCAPRARAPGLSARPPSSHPPARGGGEGGGRGAATRRTRFPGRRRRSRARLSRPRREQRGDAPRAASSAFEPPSQRQSPPHNAPRRAAFEKAARLVQDGGARPVA